MIAADGATDDELAAVAAALLVIPSVASRASADEGPPQSPWLAAARLEAIGDE